MYTICPKCKHAQQISRKQLKKKRGQLICPHCKQLFDARAALSKTPSPQETRESTLTPNTQSPEFSTLLKSQNLASEESNALTGSPKANEEAETPTEISETNEEPETSTETPEINEEPETSTEIPKINEDAETLIGYFESATETFAWQNLSPVYRPKRWLFGSIAAFILLLYQIYAFEGYSLSQNPQIRPWLATFSSLINYPLADYRSPLEYTTVGSSLKPVNKDHYQLQVSLINHADFRQPPPYLQLTLQNYYGAIFAQKIFSPQEYLGTTKVVMPIHSSAPLDIDFLIANPEQEIGGYRIELK